MLIVVAIENEKTRIRTVAVSQETLMLRAAASALDARSVPGVSRRMRSARKTRENSAPPTKCEEQPGLGRGARDVVDEQRQHDRRDGRAQHGRALGGNPAHERRL